MRMSWRTYVLILLFGIWPTFGCHQVPGDKSVQDLRPIQPIGKDKKQELTAADITQTWIAKADKLNNDGKTDQAMFDRGLDLYRERLDKNWSLTDCISFVIMRDESLTDALTADVNFVQAGFRALMRDDLH